MKKDFLKTQKALHGESEFAWQKRGDRFVLRLFADTASTVPAYKKFLKLHDVNPLRVTDLDTFKKEVPLVTKENYLKAYPLSELLPSGNIANVRMVSTSSGSSGVPFFWPRNEANIDEAAMLHELFLVDIFQIHKKRTLFINTFAMGMWVAGTTTYESIARIAERYNMTMVTPGIDIDQTLRVFDALGGYYEQIIIAGYPPFVKDVIDTARERGVALEKFHIRFLFAAESFSEEWREHILESVGSTSPLHDSLNIYGTADALLVAHETPLSILIRKLASKNDRLHATLFGKDMRIPTLAQWCPSIRYFEELQDSKIVFSAHSGIPLVRYDIGDTGNIISMDEFYDLFLKEGVNLKKEIRLHKLANSFWNLPFLTIYGRDQMTASLYGLKIYPEHIKGALEGREGNQYATGRFVMSTKHDKNKNQYLEVNIELHSKVKKSDTVAKHLESLLIKQLRTVNSEFKKLHESLGVRAVPKMILHQHQTSSLFNRKGKQKWKE